MNPAWTVGGLEFDFSAALATEKPDGPAQPLKSTDFWARYADTIWLIEVKDPDGAPSVRHGGAAAAVLAAIKNDALLKEHLLPKLYGVYAHLVETNREPRGRVRYGILIGLTTLTAAERTTLTNRLQRFVDRIGPKVRHGRFWPVVEVHNIASWNLTHPAMSVTRHP